MACRLDENYMSPARDPCSSLHSYHIRYHRSGSVSKLPHLPGSDLPQVFDSGTDTQGKAAALSTVQIDVENAERFEINYVDKDGKKKLPYILHASLSGSIDRNLYALLEEAAAKSRRGEKPSLPFWLCPTQIRLLPLSSEYVDKCSQLAKELTEIGFRADIDDREEGLGKKIREGEKEWVPLILVIGEKEVEAEKYPIRVRNGEDFSADMKELIEIMT